jgi:four helix bundle protein
MQNYENLKVWHKAHALAMEVYRIAGTFPRMDGLALTSQLRRSALSIPANIAEGAGSETPSRFRHFLQISMGSASETKYHLLVARDLQLISLEKFEELSERISEIRRMLTGLMKQIARRTEPQTTKPQ